MHLSGGRVKHFVSEHLQSMDLRPLEYWNYLPLRILVVIARERGARDFDYVSIVRDLFEDGKKMFRLRNHAIIEIGFQESEHIVQAQAVVLQSARERLHVILLVGEALENLLQLAGGSVHGVIVGDLVGDAVLFVTESFRAQICNLAVRIQIQIAEIIQFLGERKYFFANGLADFKFRGLGIFGELANVVGAFAGFPDDELDGFGSAALKNFAVGDDGFAGGDCGERGRRLWRARGTTELQFVEIISFYVSSDRSNAHQGGAEWRREERGAASNRAATPKRSCDCAN